LHISRQFLPAKFFPPNSSRQILPAKFFPPNSSRQIFPAKNQGRLQLYPKPTEGKLRKKGWKLVTAINFILLLFSPFECQTKSTDDLR
jgi:hypothetical protein